MENENLLEVKNLSKKFISKGHSVQAVSNLSFNLKKGETFSIVGESGCGKTTTGRMILRLVEADTGEILFKGINIRNLSKKQLREIRPSMQIVFQDPYGSLNPRMNVNKLISEPIKTNKSLSREKVQLECERLIQSVGLDIGDLKKYPHEFSGGQRQRIGIARAIASKPDLIICDEPVSALDLLVQAQVLNLLKDIQKKHGFTYIFISHNLSVVKYMSDRIAIMYLGEIVELGKADEIFEFPLHPYTKLLLNSILKIESKKSLDEKYDYSSNEKLDNNNCCKFSNRCPFVDEQCISLKPKFEKISDTHFVACRKNSTDERS